LRSGEFIVRTLDFAMARLDHLEWKSKLKCSLEDHGKPCGALAISHEDCDLGKWLYLDGLKKYGDYSLMMELERTHKELHSIAKNIIRMRDSGDRDGARQEFREMGPVSDKVVALLMEVEKQVAGSSHKPMGDP
jgi:methyl-accepting chemotaxis protein